MILLKLILKIHNKQYSVEMLFSVVSIDGRMLFALWLGKQCPAIAFFSSLLYGPLSSWLS